MPELTAEERRQGWQFATHKGWRVLCEDGADRAGQVFRFRHEASAFANWGHICTNRHTFVKVSNDQ